MNTTVYHAAPAVRSFAPGRTFATLGAASDFAVQASERWRVAYVVWQSQEGLLRRLATYQPERTPA
ncbi:MAG TPA: hypothetical protein VH575_10805 [Gemmataceae bacterium]|jgi:hypothetical protein